MAPYGNLWERDKPFHFHKSAVYNMFHIKKVMYSNENIALQFKINFSICYCGFSIISNQTLEFCFLLKYIKQISIKLYLFWNIPLIHISGFQNAHSKSESPALIAVL